MGHVAEMDGSPGPNHTARKVLDLTYVDVVFETQVVDCNGNHVEFDREVDHAIDLSLRGVTG